ncbi:Zn(II)2Cys6 transcription factor [Aspergillus sclerotiicarbonarius CBS 121057]|uniref:Zn(II)2Cys6 transcription factor n=1 Tax=Aspergillus sclerotiicarbonarius (strain CBS 121057 / IBT 28362) TaxID=1448318 RepID=A0A319E144_ASPSB|nr:Zn(II)2Cys6 transcription factor [Aspergillus sclerotiicarbonarius CBS 121057]
MGNPSKSAEKRRVVNACSRCRQHRIKCSGASPCSNCLLRKVKFKFEGEEAKVHITKKHLSELKRRNLELEEENRALQQQLFGYAKASPMDYPSSQSETPSPVGVLEEPKDSNEDDNSTMVNPLSCGPPKYITDGAGRPHYLGHTSNWSLTIRLLHLTHQALYKCPFPSDAHHIDTMTYSLQWDGLRSSVIPAIRRLPSLDQALFLITATKFHTWQIFHLFDEESFMVQLHQFYENPNQNIHTKGLWFIHFLVIIALEKAFVGVKANGANPPGGEYFTTALMMLPDYSFLWKDPCNSAELLCSMALYLQSIDWRTSAHNMIGQALRMLQVHGYHTNVSGVTTSKDLLRYQNVWWTVYILERQLSVLMGAPSGVKDSDINASLPHYPDSPIRTPGGALAQIGLALYQGNGDLNSTFVKATQEVLQRVANVASELREHFPVPEQESWSGISRVSGPFLFGLVETSVNSENIGVAVPMPIQLLLQICLESVKKTVSILSALQDQTLLECFLPFDLESAVSAGLVITMATLVCPSLIENHFSFLKALSGLLDQMADKGNLIAANQKRELNEIERFCIKLKSSPATTFFSDFAQPQERTAERSGMTSEGLDAIHLGSEMQPIEMAMEEAWPSSWARDMTPSQLLEVVDLLNSDDLLDWVDFSTSILDNQLE